MTANRFWGRKTSRRGFLGGALGAGAAAAAAGMLPGAGRAFAQATGAAGSFNWMTWSDHFFPEQLEEAATKYNVKGTPSLFSDNSEAFLKVQQVGGKQIDMVSGDALWVTRYFEEGLIQPFDLLSLNSARGLFDVALNVPFWKTPDGQSMAYPFGWSPVLIAYNPKYVTSGADSWELLFDPKYKGKIAMELQPFDVMAMMGKSIGIDKSYDMTLEQIQDAKKQVSKLIPNLLKFVEQNVELVQLMADETIWISTVNVGMEDRVKDAGGPEVKTFVPKEGTVGWMDSEMIVKDAANGAAALNYLDKMETGEWAAKNFMEYGRPLFNREAYYILEKQGHGDRARRYLFDKPEVALSMTLKGPSKNIDATISAFNEALAGG